MNSIKNLKKILGPITLSALSIFLSFLFIQPVATWIDPSFTLLANRGIGKIALVSIVILNVILLVALGSKEFFKKFWETNFYFFKNGKWLTSFLKFFSLFFALHVLTLSSFIYLGFANITGYSCKWTIVFSLLFGFVATFFLAWTEELIFRGTLYQMFAQQMSPLYASALASFIFMLAHDLSNPLNLITVNWRLGLGLFLLGWLLNIIFICTGKLYTGMGAHAGLVFVKVILRRIKIISFMPAAQLPFWVNADLRQSLPIHVSFALIIVILILLNKQKLLPKVSSD